MRSKAALRLRKKNRVSDCPEAFGPRAPTRDLLQVEEECELALHIAISTANFLAESQEEAVQGLESTDPVKVQVGSWAQILEQLPEVVEQRIRFSATSDLHRSARRPLRIRLIEDRWVTLVQRTLWAYSCTTIRLLETLEESVEALQYADHRRVQNILGRRVQNHHLYRGYYDDRGWPLVHYAHATAVLQGYGNVITSWANWRDAN